MMKYYQAYFEPYVSDILVSWIIYLFSILIFPAIQLTGGRFISRHWDVLLISIIAIYRADLPRKVIKTCICMWASQGRGGGVVGGGGGGSCVGFVFSR